MVSCGVFIDLKKAFDTGDYGIRGIINDWFHSYLTECVQSTLLILRFLRNSVLLVASLKGPCWGLYIIPLAIVRRRCI